MVGTQSGIPVQTFRSNLLEDYSGFSQSDSINSCEHNLIIGQLEQR